MFKSFDYMFYPMTADVYYSTQTQNSMGEIVKTWTKDRTISCSAVKRNTDSRIAPMLDSQKFIEYDLMITLRTKEDLLQSSDSTIYYVTDVLVKNIQDPNGIIVWKESVDDPTVFEIRTIEPMYNMFSGLDGYRASLIRSDKQDI